MPTAVDYNVYADQLYKLGKGYAQWQPEPTKFGEILLGDVGFLREGSFYRLFNILHDSDHPINAEAYPMALTSFSFMTVYFMRGERQYLRGHCIAKLFRRLI